MWVIQEFRCSMSCMISRTMKVCRDLSISPFFKRLMCYKGGFLACLAMEWSLCCRIFSPASLVFYFLQIQKILFFIQRPSIRQLMRQLWKPAAPCSDEKERKLIVLIFSIFLKYIKKMFKRLKKLFAMYWKNVQPTDQLPHQPPDWHCAWPSKGKTPDCSVQASKADQRLK